MTENLPPDPLEPAADDTAETGRVAPGDPLDPGPERPTAAAPPPPGDPPRRRFLRSRDDRVLAGVCGGLATYFGVDAVIVRLAAIALVFFGGAGALLYLAAILLVPDAPHTGAASGAAPPAERNRALTIIGIVVLALVAAPLLLGPAALLIPLAFVALAGLAVAWLATGRRPERDAGSLVRATLLGLGILAILALVAAAAFWTAGLGGAVVASSLVIAAGVALLVGAFVRPVRWLILPALAIAIPTGFVAAAGIELDGGFGDKSYRPGAATELAERYELGAGELVVDLRGADLPAGDRALDVEVGMGEAVLIVPEDVCVATDARVGMGLIEVFDRDSGGVDVDVEERTSAPSGTTRLVVDADVGLGHFEVRHTSRPAFDHDDRGPRFGRGDRGPFGEDRDLDLEDADTAGNRACAGAAN